MNEDPNMPELPRGWCWATVEECAARTPRAITDGPFGSNLKTSHYTTFGARVIRLQNVGDGAFIDQPAFISLAHFARLAKHEAQAGDVVIAALGEVLPRACVVPATVGPAIVKADCIRVRPSSDVVLPSFLAFALNADPTRRRTASIVHGVGRPRLNLAEVKSIRVPIAPVAEQQRIVDEVEKHFTRLDAAIAVLERVKANLKRYRASVLNAACEGRLVPTEAALAQAGGRDYEAAAVLLARILQERRARWEADQLAKIQPAGNPPKDDAWKAKYVNPPSPHAASLEALPEGWCWTTVEAVGSPGEQTVLTGPFGTSLGAGDFVSEGVPVLTIGCLTQSEIDLAKSLHISEAKAQQLSRYRVAEGDLLFSRMATVGRAGLVPERLSGALINYHIMRLRLARAGIGPRFFLAYVRGSEAVARYTREINHGATRDGINTEQLLSMPVTLPPLSEQNRIVAELDRRLSVIDQLETAVETNLKRTERLRQSILKLAFEGRLVPQDPDDEPASVLLERIRAARERTSSLSRGPGAAPSRRSKRLYAKRAQLPLPDER